MLTIFTTPKPFLGHFRTIQTNAIRSWLALYPECEIILFGKEEGNAEIALELGIRHVPEVECNEYGTPLVSYMFETAQEITSNEFVGFVSADIILMRDFMTALRRISPKKFLMVGQRWDVEVDKLLDFENPRWESQLRDHIARNGKLHPPTAVDYFVFNRGLYRNIPPFAMGRAGVDNWLIYQARFLKAQVIDASRVVTAVHQNHDTSFKVGDIIYQENGRQQPQGFWHGPERARNTELMGGTDRGFTIEHATHIMTAEGIKRALTPRRLYFQLAAVPVIHPRLNFLRKPMMALTKGIINIRRVLGITKL